uniref:Avh144 n=1 Tax=Phytophthora sojae TaxID=67593 RepID=G1FRK3_PHYSO|nr:Avh144 [Phytophthora sojae]
MRCTVAWAVAALLALAATSSATPASLLTTTDIQRLVHSTVVSQRNLPTTRLLRVHKLSSLDDEERGLPVSGLEAVANSVKSTVSVEKLREWLKRGKSTDDVFKLLTLDKAADDLLANPNLNAWINYIKLFNEENPTQKVSLIATLTAKYGDDGLAKLIEAAKKVPSTEDIAKRVQAEQLQSWLADMKTTKEVFALLALDKAADDLLASPLLNTWLSYMKLVNEDSTKKTSLLATLTAHYGADGVSKMIESAKRVPSTATMAKRLENEQIRRWIADEMYPIDVFTLLKLDKSGAELFTQPQVNTWLKFVDDFGKANPNTEKTLFAVLQKRYDEPTLVQMLIKAKNIPSMESVAVRIQAEQTKFWLGVDVDTAKEPARVFELLRLNFMYDGPTLFSSPQFNAWIKYTEEYRKIYFGSEHTIISSMEAFFDTKIVATMIATASKKTSTASIAKRLETELLRDWSKALQTPGQVFTKLELTVDYKLFERTLFPLWSKYVAYFSEVEPSFKVTLLNQLTKIYGERDLCKVLVRAEKVPKTHDIATDLLNAQLSLWLKQETDPMKVYQLLRVGRAAENDANRLLYIKYVKDYALDTKIY